MNYPSIRIEGAILSPDILDRLEDLQGQRPTDFGIPSTAKVKDEIARAWADAQDYWRIYQRKIESLRADSLATTETRNLWIVPVLGLLGYQLEYQHQGIKIDEKNYPLSHRTINRALAAVHVIGYRDPAGLDRKPERAAGPRMSAHAMVQEYLNLSDQLYAIVTNGKLLRLLRDSSRLVKLTYLEFDLDRIFTDGLFADFAVLYRLLHATRLPVSPDAAAESLIERYHQDSVESGARIRDGLSRAVEEAILAFANGLLAHPANKALCGAVRDGSLKPDAFYHHLLRLIYRLLFLLVIEERNLVYPLSPSAAKRELYYRYYSLQRLRRLAERRYLADPRHDDLWLALLACFSLFEDGGPGPKLGIAPLAGDLFGPDAIGPISNCLLDNRTVLECLRSLSLYQNPDTNQLIRVSYAALNVEEFGSVYEGLLEYEPVFHAVDGSRIEFAFAQGGERAATGSHYTPDDLVQPLLKHSLDHLIADKLKQPDKEKALLSLRVADIACGSGHILLAAARRIATELAIVRTGEEQPSPSAFRSAVRDVIRECIYGVDLNPLAVELCKVALWLEAHSPGEPLNFLDHHIKCGNAIVGFVRREELEKGVPDEAFVTMPGDDKAVAAALRRRNKEERAQKHQLALELSPDIQAHLDAILPKWKAISALPERNPAEIEKKKKRYEEFVKSDDAWLLNQIAAIPIAQFYLPKTAENAPKAVTDEQFRRFWKGEQSPQGQGPAMAWATANRKRFFHWFLEFPDIVARGGFDCILGNPPYLGGKKLSDTFGNSFCHAQMWLYAPCGLSDLVVFFLRRIFALLHPNGALALITTNSIKDGDIRSDGLEHVLTAGGIITMAVRGVKWPGRANLVVSLLAISRQCDGFAKRFLDGREVQFISALLEDEQPAYHLRPLAENRGRAFIGAVMKADGFFLSHEQAAELVRCDARNTEVVYKIGNGDELNSIPNQAAQRSVICFRDLPIERARTYSAPFAIVEREVKPDRERRDENKNAENRKLKAQWWLFSRFSMDLFWKMGQLKHCFVAAVTTKYLSVSAASAKQIYLNTVFVLPTDRWDICGVFQSNLHEVWARKYSGALETRLRYSPSDCFETFAVPAGLWQVPDPSIAAIGERYHEHRRALMLQLWLGLTDIYNLFHNRDLAPEIVAKASKKPAEAEAGYQGILQLRVLHNELDEAILAAYGWTGVVSLDHGFHEVETLPENDRVRYTISPQARREVLKRLLAENHARAQAEATAAATVAVSAPVRRRKRAAAGTGIAADMEPLAALYYPATDRDKAICAALLAAVEQTSKLDSMDHLDVGLLVTHPAWCKVFLTPADQKRLDVGVAKAPAAMFVGDNDSIRWKDARDYLEQHRNAVKVDHAAPSQPITADGALAAVKATLPSGVDEVVALALKAAGRVSQLRLNAVAATKEQQRLLALFRQEARSVGLAIA